MQWIRPIVLKNFYKFLPDRQLMDNETSSLVIACLPVYNAELFIEETIQCLKNQSYQNFKVVISDDNSTDRSVALIQSFINDDNRFILIKQEKNLGWVDNLNFLMAEAISMGDYVFLYPHDDLIEPDYIKKLSLVLDSDTSAAMAFCDLKIHNKI